MADESILRNIRTNPGPYLFEHARVDAAAVCANILLGVYDKEGCFTTPSHVEFSSRREHHHICAIDCHVRTDARGITQIPQDYGNTVGLVDYLWQQSLVEPDNRPVQPKPLEAFSYAAIAVFASEYCVVDVCTRDEHFRQGFHQGRAVTPCDRRALSGVADGRTYLQLMFTVAPPVFRSRLMAVSRFVEVLGELQRRAWILPDLQLKKRSKGEHDFDARLALD